MKVIKPFEAPQRSVKIKMIFSLIKGREMLIKEYVTTLTVSNGTDIH